MFNVLVSATLFLLLFAGNSSAINGIKIDALNVNIVNNSMTDTETQRVFNYAVNRFYEQGEYRNAIKAFALIEEYSKSNLIDDAMYYIGKSYYFIDSDDSYINKFNDLYSLYPDGNIVSSGNLTKTLINIMSREKRNDFIYILKSYYLIERFDSKKASEAKKIIMSRAAEKVRISIPKKNISKDLKEWSYSKYGLHIESNKKRTFAKVWPIFLNEVAKKCFKEFMPYYKALNGLTEEEAGIRYKSSNPFGKLTYYLQGTGASRSKDLQWFNLYNQKNITVNISLAELLRPLDVDLFSIDRPNKAKDI